MKLVFTGPFSHRVSQLLLGAGLMLAISLSLTQQASAIPPAGWVSTTIDGGVANLRATPSTSASVQATAANGSRFSIVAEQFDSAGYRWYQVRPDGVTPTSAVWIRADLVSFAPPFPAQPRLSCDSAIAATEKTLRAVPNTTIRTRDQRPHGYANGPADRPDSYSYQLSGSGAPNVLASPVLMNQLAAQLIENCPRTGLISFSDGPTDGNYTNYGAMPQRMVRPFQCKLGPNSDRGPAQWGESICL
ncbi:MAG: SH3 domain-containing protein [Phormidesmis sp.]